MDVYQRRRVAIAAVFTLAAVPIVMLLDSGDSDSSAVTDGSGTIAAVETTIEFTVPTTAEQLPVFLDNTAVIVPPAVIDVARPEATTATEQQGRATYLRYLQASVTRPCTAPRAPSGAVITVTNIDNGLSATCTNTLGVSIAADIDIAIDTQVFTTIADLVDAPIFVRMSW
jgi:hypothetical protein